MITYTRQQAPRLATACVLVFAYVCLSRSARADIYIDRDVMTVTTTNLIAVFRGPDLFRLTNRLTNEQYLRPPAPFRGSLDMGLLEPTGRTMTGDFWRMGRNELSAQFVAKDLTRTVYLNVIIDPETQDITLTLWGESLKEGATGLTWGMRGLDLSGGRLVLPVQGGRSADESTKFGDLGFHYPGDWEAQMMIWEDKLNSGGFVVYSRDEELRYKQLHISRHDNRVDIGFETQAHAPWTPNGSVKAVEWRINTYKGDWKVPATGYRNLANFLRPGVPLRDDRAWIKEVRCVASVEGKPPSPALLDSLGKTMEAKRTLLFVPGWRKDGYDPNEADYVPREGIKAFVEKAHELGFHVMLPIEPPGCDSRSGDYERVRKAIVKDAVTGKQTTADSRSFASYNPAYKPFRDLLVARLKVMMDDVSPDVLFLRGAGTLPNDGSGLIDNRSFSEGAVAMHRAILTAFPNLLLGTDGMNELVTPYSTVSLRSPASSLPPHPISTMLFSSSTFSASVPSPSTPLLAPLDGQALFPVLVVSSPSDIENPSPDTATILKLAKTWQGRNVIPDWASPWKGAQMRWVTEDGNVIIAEKTGDSVTMRLGNEVIAQRSLKPAKTTATVKP
jgi:hypothetical protein